MKNQWVLQVVGGKTRMGETQKNLVTGNLWVYAEEARTWNLEDGKYRRRERERERTK